MDWALISVRILVSFPDSPTPECKHWSCAGEAWKTRLGRSSVPPLIKCLVVRQLIFCLSHSQLLLKMCTPVQMAASTVRGWSSQEERVEGAQKDIVAENQLVLFCFRIAPQCIKTCYFPLLLSSHGLEALSLEALGSYFEDHCCMISSSVPRSNTTKLQEAWVLYLVPTVFSLNYKLYIQWQVLMAPKNSSLGKIHLSNVAHSLTTKHSGQSGLGL